MMAEEALREAQEVEARCWDRLAGGIVEEAEEEPDDEAALSIEDEVLSIEDEVLSIVNEGSIVPLVYDSSIMSDIQVSEWCLEEQLQVVEGRLMASLFDAITFVSRVNTTYH